MKQTQTEILVELKTIMTEVLRRVDTQDRIIVPRTEHELAVQELRRLHTQNQKDIEEVQKDLRSVIYKMGFALGTLNVITAIAFFLMKGSS